MQVIQKLFLIKGTQLHLFPLQSSPSSFANSLLSHPLPKTPQRNMIKMAPDLNVHELQSLEISQIGLGSHRNVRSWLGIVNDFVPRAVERRQLPQGVLRAV